MNRGDNGWRARPAPWTILSNAPLTDNQARTIHIIHPFHPLTGSEFELVDYRHNRGEDRVNFLDSAGRLSAIPASWTDLIAPDPFVAVSAGRSLFRLDDLLRLAELVASMQPPT
jgi:hypothetical protein